MALLKSSEFNIYITTAGMKYSAESLEEQLFIMGLNYSRPTRL